MSYGKSLSEYKEWSGNMNIYDFTVKNNLGEMVPLSNYKGKVLLIVNTATKCGLTPQYKEMQALYEKYHGKGFELLDFPCNQFAEQAPGDDVEINQFCTLNYGTTFPRFSKIDVNGESANPLYAWLKKEAPEDLSDEVSLAFEERLKTFRPEPAPGEIKWNFGKFLIDKSGNVIARYSPALYTGRLEQDIEKALNA